MEPPFAGMPLLVNHRYGTGIGNPAFFGFQQNVPGGAFGIRIGLGNGDMDFQSILCFGDLCDRDAAACGNGPNRDQHKIVSFKPDIVIVFTSGPQFVQKIVCFPFLQISVQRLAGGNQSDLRAVDGGGGGVEIVRLFTYRMLCGPRPRLA